MQDAYFERLTRIKTTRRNVLLLLAIWGSALILGVLAVLMVGLPGILLLGIAIYGGVMLTKKLAVEYEYLFTNGEMDLDLIIGRAERKRLANFTCKQIVSLKPFTGELPTDCVKVWNCVNPGYGTPYVLVFLEEGEGKKAMVIDLPPAYLDVMKPYLNPAVSREAMPS